MDFTKPKVDAETAVYPDSYINFFVKFMATDALGRIANAWLCWAEKEPERAASAKCIELAKKFSLAVDYPKTGGSPIVMPRELVPDEYPDYMQNSFKGSFYSKSFIGESFRHFKQVLGSFMHEFEQEKILVVDKDLINYTGTINRSVAFYFDLLRFLFLGSELWLDDAQKSFEDYDHSMSEIMRIFNVTEVEAFSGIILADSKTTKRR